MYIKNPLTGRDIKVGGSTYKKLQKMGGHPTSGWAIDAPKIGKQRHQLKQKCGDECFILPETEKFPICAKNNCQIDCRGLISAKIRAHQHKYTNIYDKIDKLIEKNCK